MIITGKKFSKPEMSRVINGDKTLAAPEKSPETRRLDHILVEKYPDFNRSQLQKFIKEGRASVNGKIIKKPNFQIAEADDIDFTPPDLTRPAPPKPDVIYEDANVLVLNKPIGLLSMSKGAYNPEPTLEDYGLLVHRLDRDTSGVVILAKNEPTQKMLRKQFQDRKTKKTYYAVTSGHPKEDAALIDLPIARNYKHPTTFLVQPGGKPSQTSYQVLQKTPHFSLLELKPATGRTHQLRVHLKYLGTPILGDRLYGDAKVNAKLPVKSEKDPEPRLYLHAGQLEISIPSPANTAPTAPDTASSTPDANIPATPHKNANLRKTFTAPTPVEFSEIIKNDAAAGN